MRAIDRINSYVKDYNQARANNDIDRAIRLGNKAVSEARDCLNESNFATSDRQYLEQVVKDIEQFLANPQAYVVVPHVAGGGDSADKIQETDWFAAPIPNLGMGDIAGLQDVKDEFIVSVFAPTYPELAPIYKKYRGEEVGLQILLYGPPGTGKTHVVKCLAGALKCKIAVVQIKDVMANLVGDGAKIIASVFEQAKQHDRCIIFFDEIDAIASSREGDDSRHTKEQLTTLLTNMDGFTSATKPGQLRIVIAATNRPWALDSAVKRGGRFDTQILVPIPDADARKELFKRNFPEFIPHASDVTLDWLVKQSVGYSGADIKSICRQASGLPLKREIKAALLDKPVNDQVTKSDFEKVFGRYINSITREMLEQYDAYSQNMDFQEYLKYVKTLPEEMKVEREAHLLNMTMDDYVVYKGRGLLEKLYNNYALEVTGDTKTYSRMPLSELDLITAKIFYWKGLFEKHFDENVSFLEKILPIEFANLAENELARLTRSLKTES